MSIAELAKLLSLKAGSCSAIDVVLDDMHEAWSDSKGDNKPLADGYIVLRKVFVAAIEAFVKNPKHRPYESILPASYKKLIDKLKPYNKTVSDKTKGLIEKMVRDTEVAGLVELEQLCSYAENTMYITDNIIPPLCVGLYALNWAIHLYENSDRDSNEHRRVHDQLDKLEVKRDGDPVPTGNKLLELFTSSWDNPDVQELVKCLNTLYLRNTLVDALLGLDTVEDE